MIPRCSEAGCRAAGGSATAGGRRKRHGHEVRLRRLVRLALLLAGSLAARPAPAQLLEAARPAEEEIHVDAESLGYDKRQNTVVGTGNVVIRRGESVLFAEEVRLDRNTNEAQASGGVCLSDPEGTICGDHMRLDLDDETGKIVGARIQSKRRHYTLRGDEVEKEEGQKYRIKNGYFTTCDCGDDTPSWSIAADEVSVEVDGYGVVDSARFNILDVPVLYIPRGALPVGRERQSGLLFPRVGASNKRGFQYFQPLYWAINKSHDATVAVDVETSARLGAVGEYRYALSRNSIGNITASYFNETIRGRASETNKGTGGGGNEDDEGDAENGNGSPNVPIDRWGVTTEHTQCFGDAKGYADLLLVGDDLFLREINTYRFENREEVKLRTRPFTESRVGVVQPWQRAYLHAEGTYYQDLIGRDELVLQRAPEVRLSAQKFLPFGLLADVGASAVNFQREEGIDGLRGTVEPGLELRLPLGRFVYGSAGVRFREAAYQLTDRSMDGGFRGDCTDVAEDPDDAAGGDGFCDENGDPVEVRLPSRQTRETVELGARIGTGVSRVFTFDHFGFDRLRHSIEPHLSYLYIPDVSQEDVMVFDGEDRIDRRNLFTYGLVTRLLGRRAGGDAGAGRIWELTRFSVAQAVDLTANVPTATSDGPEDRLTDLDFAMRINPIERTSLRFRATYDPASDDLTSATVGVRLREARRDDGRLQNRTSIGISYRFITDNPLELEDPPEPAGIQQIDSDIALRLTDRFGLLYANRFNIREERFLENHFGVRLLSACDCWSLDVGVTDKSNPNEIELRAQLVLVGLGGGFGNAP